MKEYNKDNVYIDFMGKRIKGLSQEILGTKLEKNPHSNRVLINGVEVYNMTFELEFEEESKTMKFLREEGYSVTKQL